MKKFLAKHRDILITLILVFIWRFYFLLIETASYGIDVRRGYLGFLRIANFDGVYYLYIAQYGYHGLDQAFFPLFPIAINVFIRLGLTPIDAAIFVATGSLIGFLYTLLKLLKIDYPDKNFIWILIFFLAFPSSFFLGGIYTEGFFLFLTILSFYFARKKKVLTASIFGALASATRIIGIFILPSLIFEIYEQQRKSKKKNLLEYSKLAVIPVGLLGYMGYLWYKYKDPLLFVHEQPDFGAGRSGGQIILLPQVIYRYIKIFLTLPKNNLTFWVSVTEFSTLIIGCLILILAYKKGIRKSYILFSACALLFPTLSGTLSSLPRYILASFAVFIFLGLIKNKYLKTALIILSLIIEAIFAALFLQGYFVA